MAFRLHRLAPVVAVLLAVAAAAGLPACTGGGGGGGGGCPVVTCQSDAACGLGGYCTAGNGATGTCLRRPAFCADDRHAMNDRGEFTDCGYYRCQDGFQDSTNLVRGTCVRDYLSGSDCKPGSYWDAVSGWCICTSQTGPCGWDNFAPPVFSQCMPTCGKDADCGTGNMCWQGKCAHLDSYCELVPGTLNIYDSVTPDQQLPLPASGSYPRIHASCGSYACDKSTGQCMTDCQVQDDCAQGKLCYDVDHTCRT
jgi:hypothetical protein